MVCFPVMDRNTQLIYSVDLGIPTQTHDKRLPTPPKSRRYLSQSGDVDYVPSPFEELDDLTEKARDRFGITNTHNPAGLSDEAYDQSVDKMASELKARAKSRQWARPEDSSNRRVPIKTEHPEPGTSNQEPDSMHHIQFIGERLVSLASLSTGFLLTVQVSITFERYFESFYDPERHWTSPLRSRVGFSEPKDPGPVGAAPFTFPADAITLEITKFLVQHAGLNTSIWNHQNPTYHFEVAVTEGNDEEAFVWDAAQMERVSELSNLCCQELHARR